MCVIKENIFNKIRKSVEVIIMVIVIIQINFTEIIIILLMKKLYFITVFGNLKCNITANNAVSQFDSFSQ